MDIRFRGRNTPGVGVEPLTLRLHCRPRDRRQTVLLLPSHHRGPMVTVASPTLTDTGLKSETLPFRVA